MSKQSKKPARHWVITQNDEKQEPQFDSESMRFLVYQIEEAPSTGHLHYQGYVQFHNPKGFKTVSKLFPKAYVAPAKGSPAENYAYCTKAESRMPDTEPKQFGTMSEGQGDRSDWKVIKSLLKDKKPDIEIAERYPRLFALHYKGINHLRNTLQPTVGRRNVRGFVLFGEPGVGKSKRVWERFGYDPLRLFAPDLSKNTVWWDGYIDQSAVLFDDFTGTGLTLQSLNRILDPYPLQIPYKGLMGYARFETVYFTTNIHPSNWYKDASEIEIRSLLRRLHITHVKRPPPILIRPVAANVSSSSLRGHRVISLLEDDEEEDDIDGTTIHIGDDYGSEE